MPEDQIVKIEVLLKMALARAGAGWTRKGMGKLSQAIAKDIITQKYLDEQLFKKIEQAKKEGKTTISPKEEYLEALANYVDYKSYSAYDELLEEMTRLIAHYLPLDSKKLLLVHDVDDADFLEKKLRHLFYQNQQPLSRQSIHFDKDTFSVEMWKWTERASLLLWWISDEHFIKSGPEGVNLFLAQSKAKEQECILPIWADMDKQETIRSLPQFDAQTWLSEDQFPLFIQLLLVLSEEKSKISEGESPTNISDAGTVIFGNSSVVNEGVMANRDIHNININKD